VSHGSAHGGGVSPRGASRAAAVAADGGELGVDHPGLRPRQFICGAAVRIPVLPERLPDAHRLELFR
jgi:hypothetical protein